MKTMPEIGKNADGTYNLFKVSGDIAKFLLTSMRPGETVGVATKKGTYTMKRIKPRKKRVSKSVWQRGKL